jgi:phytoene dehydrogenase-like protein
VSQAADDDRDFADETDVVVIGAGHNGLVAACYLAMAGLAVTVCEASPNVGGMTASAALIPEAPNHLLNPCAVDLTFLRATQIESDLNLAASGFRHVEVDPPIVHLHDSGASLAIWRDPARTADELRFFSPADAQAYLRLARTLDTMFAIGFPLMDSNPQRPSLGALGRTAKAAVGRYRDLPDLVSFARSSTAQLIDERFTHPVVRDALAAVAATLTPPNVDGGALPLMFLGFLHRVGASRPIGGMQAFPEALASSARAHGARVYCGAEVDEILVETGAAVGVRLKNGRTINAHTAVLASCDPRMALHRLLAGGTGSKRVDARVAQLPAHAQGGAWFKVDVALSGQLTLSRHQAQRRDGLDLRIPAGVIGSFDDSITNWKDSEAGRFPTRPIMYTAIPTAVDPSQAPAGQDCLYLWASPVPAHPAEPWPSTATDSANTVVRRASDFYDNISDLEIGRWVETPDDAEQRLRATGGSMMHVDLSVGHLGPLRPALGLGGYRTPIDRLYLGAAGSHPGGGVSGLPGRLAAKEILRGAGHASR